MQISHENEFLLYICQQGIDGGVNRCVLQQQQTTTPKEAIIFIFLMMCLLARCATTSFVLSFVFCFFKVFAFLHGEGYRSSAGCTKYASAELVAVKVIHHDHSVRTHVALLVSTYNKCTERSNCCVYM